MQSASSTRARRMDTGLQINLLRTTIPGRSSFLPRLHLVITYYVTRLLLCTLLALPMVHRTTRNVSILLFPARGRLSPQVLWQRHFIQQLIRGFCLIYMVLLRRILSPARQRTVVLFLFPRLCRRSPRLQLRASILYDIRKVNYFISYQRTLWTKGWFLCAVDSACGHNVELIKWSIGFATLRLSLILNRGTYSGFLP